MSYAVAKPSASVVIVRQADTGPEVLMVLRNKGSTFGASFVFPGGMLEADDDAVIADCDGVDDGTANATLGLPEGGSAYFSAAIRELFEETGILLARTRDRRWADSSQYADERIALNEQRLSWAAFLQATELRLACDQLNYFAYWVTPRDYRRRFSARFFLAPLPPGQNASQCGGEITAVRWIAPERALTESAEQRIELPRPTIANLKSLQRFDTASAMLDWSRGRAADGVQRVLPVFIGEGENRRVVLPGEPEYPEGVGEELMRHNDTAPTVEDVVPGLRRLVAPNPGMMTGPGTNTYLLGRGEIAVIDPGPRIDAHIEHIVAAAGAPIRWILVTHTHPDHSPAAAPLAALTGATQIGMAAPVGPHQDGSFEPDQTPIHGERLTLGDVELEAVHTPGHASNHFCYFLRAHGCLVTGDHIINGSTVVIDPPDGSMADYLKALELLKGYPLEMLAPGHGEIIHTPFEAIDALIAHRLRRERKVRTVLEDHPESTLGELVRHVYAEVDASLHRVAERSLLAHLLKLREEGLACTTDERWSATKA